MTKLVKKYTRIERQEIIAQVERLRHEAGLTLPRACARIRVPYTTYYDWIATGKVTRLLPLPAPTTTPARVFDFSPHRQFVRADL